MVTSYTYGGISHEELEDFRKDVQRQLECFKTMSQAEIDAWFKALMEKEGADTPGAKKSARRRQKAVNQ